jgi:NitT/TauT family transport system substrate-binding protein
MQRRTRVKRSVGFLAAALMLSAACGAPAAAPAKPASGGGSAKATAASAPAATGPVSVNIGAVNDLFGTALFVGVEKGFFAKFGLSPHIKVFSTGQALSTALTSGQVQFGSSAMNVFQEELAGKINHVALGVEMGNGSNAIGDDSLSIVASPQSHVRAGHPADLRGKKVGMPLGSTAELYLRAVLAKNGVPASSVQFANVPPGQDVTLLKNHGVDAVSAWEPYGSMMLSEVPGSVLVERDGGILGYVIFLLAQPQEIQQHPQVVQKFIDAYAEAAQFVRQHPKQSASVDAHWIPGSSAKINLAGLKHVPWDPRITKFTVQDWDLSNKLLTQLKMLKAQQPMAGHFDTTFIAHTMQKYPQFFSDLTPQKEVAFK